MDRNRVELRKNKSKHSTDRSEEIHSSDNSETNRLEPANINKELPSDIHVNRFNVFKDKNSNETDNNNVDSVVTPVKEEANLVNDIEANIPKITTENNEPKVSAEKNEPKITTDIKSVDKVDPAKLNEPIRTDPIKALEARKRRLDRQADACLPEIHFVGQITSGYKIISDVTEGAFCRWKVEYGKAWQHLGGEIVGQTHVSYCNIHETESLIFSHPIDVHFAAAGLQGWGSPRLSVQCYRLDWHGRRILAGYGFVHLPISVGCHRLEVNLWRPVGTPEQDLKLFLLGQSPSLASHDPIYESAWKERCRLLTVASGSIFIDIFVVTRYLQKQGIDSK